MSTGGNAPRRVLGVRRQLRRAMAVFPRRSLRIARRAGVIDAVTESVLVHAGVQRPRRRRRKLTARRSDGSRVNRVQLATRAAARAQALYADVQSIAAAFASVDAKKFAEAAAQAANEAAHIHAHAEAQRLAILAAAEQSMRASVEFARDAAETEIRARSEVAVGPDPDETDVEDGIFSDYEPSIPNYSPLSHVYSVDDVEADLTPAEESDDDIQCGQPLSPLCIYKYSE